MNAEVKKHLDQISEEDAKEIINGNNEIKEWIESQKKRNNNDTHRNTGSINSFARKKNE